MAHITRLSLQNGNGTSHQNGNSSQGQMRFKDKVAIITGKCFKGKI